MTADEPDTSPRVAVAFRLTPHLARQIKEIAVADGSSVSRTVEHLLFLGLLLPGPARQRLRSLLRHDDPVAVTTLRTHVVAALDQARKDIETVVENSENLALPKDEGLTDAQLGRAFAQAMKAYSAPSGSRRRRHAAGSASEARTGDASTAERPKRARDRPKGSDPDAP